MFDNIIGILEQIEIKIDARKNITHPLDGDTLLDTADLCQLFKVSKRSIAEYRRKKLITTYKVDRKAYCKASEVQEFLKKKGKL